MIKIQNSKFKIQNLSERGAILIFSLLIMAMVMSITFAVLGIFLPKLKVASDPIKSVVALFAADSGLEWCVYINRGRPTPEPLPKPVIGVAGGAPATVDVYFPSSGFTPATCLSAETPLDHRAVGTYLGVARSLEIR